MATNDFKPFATGVGANVTSQEDWEALAALVTGFQSGKASSAQVNKAIRQATTIGSVVGQFIADSDINALDNGNVDSLTENFKEALDKNILNGFDTSILFNGYQKLPSGLTQQWGRVSVTTDSQGNFVVTPDASLFPTGIVFGRIDMGESSYSGASRVIVINTYPNTTLKKTITAIARYADNGSPVASSPLNVTFDVIGH